MAGTSSFAPPKLADFILTEKLGRGTYATVYKAYRKGDSREVVAIKVVEKKTLNKASTENLLTEIEILKTLRHPHIVQLKDFQWDAENIYLILEWCSGGDLSCFIRSRKILPERVARRFLQQMACALQFLNERNISHLDLKPQNILLHGSVLKLADFGFAQYMSPWDEQSVLRGSPLYMAPEMVCRRQYDSRVDLWSVGVILYEALFGRAPFASKSYTELVEKIRSNQPIELPPGARVSKDCRDLLLRLLERNPDARITFAEFFTHPFVDLEHMSSAESLAKAKEMVLQAVQKDQEGERSAALSLYCGALEHFVPAIHYETDRQRKETLRHKVNRYVSRAEELKALVAADNRLSFEEARTSRDVLREMSRDQPRLLTALQLASTAIAKEESGLNDQEALDVYQQCLGELLLVLAAGLTTTAFSSSYSSSFSSSSSSSSSLHRSYPPRPWMADWENTGITPTLEPPSLHTRTTWLDWLVDSCFSSSPHHFLFSPLGDPAEPQGRRRELLHGEIQSLMSRAEYIKKNIKMQETHSEASLDREPLADSVRYSCCLQ